MSNERSGRYKKLKHALVSESKPVEFRYRYDLVVAHRWMQVAILLAWCVLDGSRTHRDTGKATLIRPQIDSRMESQLRFPNGTEAHVICDMLRQGCLIHS